MLRAILAGIIGVVAAFATVAAAEAIGQQFYPAPVGLDLNDRGAMTDYIKAMPIGAFLMIAAGWFLAVLVGAVAAVLVSRSRPRAFALIVGAAVLLAAILNFVFIPHPLWFVAFGLAAVIVAIWPASAIAESIAGVTSRPNAPYGSA